MGKCLEMCKDWKMWRLNQPPFCVVWKCLMKIDVDPKSKTVISSYNLMRGLKYINVHKSNTNCRTVCYYQSTYIILRYSSAVEMKSLPIWGERDWYSGGGYVIHLKNKTSDIIKKFNELQRSHWIDRKTRAIILEFSSYNSQVREKQ